MLTRLLAAAVLLTLVLGLSAPSTATAAPTASQTAFTVALSGAAEVPGPGDSDGSGTAVLRLIPQQGLLCYRLLVSGIGPATAAHVHIGPAGVAGPVVIFLAPPTNGSSSACVAVNTALLAAIAGNPAGYYVNVHNAAFPAGALRGQLG